MNNLPERRPWKVIVRFAATEISSLAATAFARVVIKAHPAATAEGRHLTTFLTTAHRPGGPRGIQVYFLVPAQLIPYPSPTLAKRRQMGSGLPLAQESNLAQWAVVRRHLSSLRRPAGAPDRQTPVRPCSESGRDDKVNRWVHRLDPAVTTQEIHVFGRTQSRYGYGSAKTSSIRALPADRWSANRPRPDCHPA